MTYQPTPFSLIMPEVPAYMSDGEIARLWGQYPYIRSIQMEPFIQNSQRCNRVTIHFDDFKGYGDELREHITNGYYKTTTYDFPTYLGGAYLRNKFSSYLIPCESSNPPRNEYSHIVAFQLQDIVHKQVKQIQDLESRFDLQLQAIVRKQADQIQRLESKIDEMETKIHEGTDLYVDINQSYTVIIERFETRLNEQDAYCKCLEERIMDTADILNKHIEHSFTFNKSVDELKQETKALTEWCSRPIWNRTASFRFQKEPNFEFTSEF